VYLTDKLAGTTVSQWASGRRRPLSLFRCELGSGGLGQGLGFRVGAEGDGEESRGPGDQASNEKIKPPLPLFPSFYFIFLFITIGHNFQKSVTISVKNF